MNASASTPLGHLNRLPTELILRVAHEAGLAKFSGICREARRLAVNEAVHVSKAGMLRALDAPTLGGNGRGVSQLYLARLREAHRLIELVLPRVVEAPSSPIDAAAFEQRLNAWAMSGRAYGDVRTAVLRIRNAHREATGLLNLAPCICAPFRQCFGRWRNFAIST